MKSRVKPHVSTCLPSILERLEERVMFDAAPDAPALSADAPALEQTMSLSGTDQAPSQATDQEVTHLVFVDRMDEQNSERLSSVLLRNPDRSFQVYELDGEASLSEKLEFISRVVATTEDGSVDSIWILLEDDLSSEFSGEDNANDDFLGVSSRSEREILDWYSSSDRIEGWRSHLKSDGRIHYAGANVLVAQDQIERLTGAKFSTELVLPATVFHEVIFVDASVTDYQTLVDVIAASRDAEIVVLDPNEDGVLKIAEHLSGRHDISAIHLVSHGTPGELKLGSATLNIGSMQGDYADAMRVLGAALTEDGDILIYGCDFTADQIGLSAAIVLGGLTGADIASSSNATGHASLGGDWELESRHGAIETTAIAGSAWRGLLAPPTVSSPNAVETLEDIAVHFNGANRISVGSNEVGTLTVTLAVSHGRIGLSTTTGLTFLNSTSNNQSVIEISGTIAALNTALNGLVYTSDENYFGADNLSVSANDGNVTTVRTTRLSIVSQNDAPVIVVNPVNLDGTGTPSETAPHTFTFDDFHAVDPDNTNNQLTFSLNSLPTVGEIRLNGYPVTVGTIFTQTQLANGALQYVHNGGEVHSDTFTVSVKDGAGGSHGPVAIPITITRVNDPMSVSVEALVYEGGSTSDAGPGAGKPVPGLTLSISDAEGDPKYVTIDTLPLGGVLLFNGTVISQSDIDNGFTILATEFNSIEYVHDGVDDLGHLPGNRSFQITVFDEGGSTPNVQSVSLNVTIHVVSVNDELELVHHDDSLHYIPIGNSYTLSLSDMNVTDPDGPDGLVTYTLENSPTQGILRINGEAVGAGASFTQAQLQAGHVVFHHRFGGLDSLRFTARDGSISILTDELGALRTGDAHSPHRVLTLNFDFEVPPPDGGTVIDAELLEGTSYTFDDFSPGDTLTLSSLPEYGTLTLNGVPVLLGDVISFSATDQLVYHHGGAHVGHDQFDLVLNGEPLGVNVLVFLVNDPPVLTILQPLTTVYEGQNHVIDSNWLHASDEETTDPAELIYTITGYPSNGTLYMDGEALGSFSSFSHQDVIDGRISYTHNGGELFLDSVTLSLSDGALSDAKTLQIQAIPVNDQPTIGNSFLQLLEGETKQFTAHDLNVSDADGVGADLPISVDSPLHIRIESLPTHGTLWYNDPVLGMIEVAPGFTLDRLDIERLYYEHDSSENFHDSFGFTVIDNNNYDTPYDAPGERSGVMVLDIIPQNDPPEVVVNKGLVQDADGDRRVYEGGVRVLTPDVLLASDPDSSDEQVQYLILNAPANGQLLLNGIAIGVGSAFTQEDLIAGRVSYRHNGSETLSDSFLFRIDDSASNVTPVLFHIGVIPINDAPSITAPDSITVNSTDFHFTGSSAIRIADVDAESGEIAVTLTTSDTAGELRVTSSAGVVVAGDGTSSLTLTGTLAAVNSALESLRYRTSDVNGEQQLTVYVSDQGNTGADPSQVPPDEVPGLVNTGGIDYEEASRVIRLLVSTINEPQVNTFPGPQETNEDVSIVFSNPAGNGFRVDDPDHLGSPLEVTLSVTHGALTLATTAGLTFSTGSGTNNTTMTFRGTQDAINAALEGMTFSGGTNFNGSSVLTFTTNDLGNTGEGAPNTFTDTVDITVHAVNDAPTVSTVTGITLINGVTPVTGLQIRDVDYTDGNAPATTLGEHDFVQATVRLLPPTGAAPLTAAQHANVQFTTTATAHGATIDSIYDGDGSALVIRGTLAQVNAYLAGLTIDISGALINSDVAYRLQVVADDRLRDLGTGGLDGSGLANGGPNAAGSGVANVPVAQVDPYGAIPVGLQLNVGSATRSIIASSLNDAPFFSNVNGTRTYTEGTGLTLGTPIALAPNGTLSDPELSVFNNWQHAVLTIQRQGGANSEDIFGVTGSGNSGVNISGGNIRIGTTVIGTVTNASGTMTITVTRNATSDGNMNTILRAITYANSSQVPPESVNIQFTISDGDTDPDRANNPQGTGGAMTGTAVVNVNIIDVNDAPTIENLPPVTYVEDGVPIVLAPNAVPHDHELNTHDAGVGNWSNATLTVARDGGANSSDHFSSSGILSALNEGSLVTLGGVGVGTVTTNSNGTLAITFAEGTTTAQVQQVMRSIAYLNDAQQRTNGESTSSALRWTLNDGDTDPDRASNPQGTGGALSGASVQNLTLLGTNDPPAGEDFERTINQDSSYTLAVSDFGFHDPVDQPGDEFLNVIISSLPTRGNLTLNGVNVTAGQSISVVDIQAGRLVWTPIAGEGGADYSTFTFQVQDDGGTLNGGQDTDPTPNTVVFHVNRAPVVSSPLPDRLDWDGDVIDLNLAPFFTDPEDHTVSYAVTGLPVGLNVDSSTGIISGTIDRSASVSGPYPITVTVTDELGASTTRTFNWNVSNPPPIALNDQNATTEIGTATGSVLVNDSDPDGDPLTVIEVNGGTAGVGVPVAGSHGGIFTLRSDGTYDFDTNGDFDYLAAGEFQSTEITYTISDGEGGTAQATLTIRVNGMNDSPVSTSIPNQTNQDSDELEVDLSSYFSDPNPDDELTFADGGTLPPGLTIDPVTGIVSGKIDSSASTGGPYTVTITATDPHGGSTSQTFVWGVTNPPPLAVDDDYTVSGSSPATVVGSATDNDSDPDGDAIYVTPQTNIPGSNGGLFSIDADGVVTFDPNGEWDHIPVYDSSTTTLQYTIVDADGETSTAIITVTVFGANNPPVAKNDTYEVTGTSVSGNAMDNDMDPDGHPITGTVTEGPKHGTLEWHPDGSFTYTPGPTFLGSDEFTYTITDIHGATSTAVVTITRSFAWDSFRNESIPPDYWRGIRTGFGSEQLMSAELDYIASQPILAGYATPGAILKGKIYDPSGTLLAEVTTQVNQAGNWVMNFFEVIKTRNPIVVIEHIATEEVILGDLDGFRLTESTYRSMQLGYQHHKAMTVGTILCDRPSLVLERMHYQNLNPLSLR